MSHFWGQINILTTALNFLGIVFEFLDFISSGIYFTILYFFAGVQSL
jgi:hypothetical protein